MSGRYDRCGDPHPLGVTCLLVVGHPGRHRYDDGYGGNYVWGTGWQAGEWRRT